MIQVLFVCLGNICRSPVAEGVFRKLVAEKGLEDIVQCDSAGTAAYHVGSLPDKRMRKVALTNGIALTHCARQLSYQDFTNYDYILSMDESNFESIRKEGLRANDSYSSDQQLFLYRMFDSERGNNIIVPDPYYGELSDFQEVFNIVERSGKAFLEFLVKKHNLIVKIRD